MKKKCPHLDCWWEQPAYSRRNSRFCRRLVRAVRIGKDRDEPRRNHLWHELRCRNRLQRNRDRSRCRGARCHGLQRGKADVDVSLCRAIRGRHEALKDGWSRGADLGYQGNGAKVGSVGHIQNGGRIVWHVCGADANHHDVKRSGRQRAEVEVAVAVRDRLHEDAVDARRVLLFNRHLHASHDRRLGDGIQHYPADSGVICADLPSGERGLQTEFTVTFLHDRSAGVEINVQIDALARGYVRSARRQSAPEEFSAQCWPGYSRWSSP